MELRELITKDRKELLKLLAKNREKLRSLKFSVSAKQLKNIREVREVRRLVARILTTLNSKKEDGSQDTNKEEKSNQVV